MGECQSACRPICLQHSKTESTTSRQQQRREIILTPYSQLAKKGYSLNTATNELIEPLPELIDFKQQTKEQISQPKVEAPIEKNEILVTGEQTQQHHHLPDLQMKQQQQEIIPFHQVEFTQKEQDQSLLNYSYLPDMQPHSPQLIMPSMIDDSLIEKWHQPNYEPSKLFLNFDYDGIFKQK